MLFSQGNTDCKPIEVMYDESRFEILNNHIDRIISDGEILCASYCITRKGKVIAHNGIGKQSYREDDNRTVPFNAIHYIASITKVFTAVAIMKLVEDGKLRLDQPVCEFLQQFKNAPFNAITVFDLLTHTSGMHPDTACFPNEPTINVWDLIETQYKQHNKDDGEFDWIAAALTNGVRMEPAKEWAYCSFGFVILGAVIEKITGIKAEKYIEDYITKPLGMNDTTFNLDKTDKSRWIVQREHWYDRLNGKDDDENAELWSRIPETGGGLYSTAYDLTLFGRCMMNKGTLNGVRILGKKAAEKMTTLAIHNVPDYCWGAKTKSRGYGIGFDMRNGPAFTFSEGTFNHEGAGACSLYIDPHEELVAAWFVPYRDDGWHPNAMWNVQNIIWSGIIE
ncbi:MAG TPA: serine hydrolase domain-containing protein [Oscillospiraceae bacterium]|nr:serine hydrolase domain-containing protein [Oscillospiraceae bacterium]